MPKVVSKIDKFKYLGLFVGLFVSLSSWAADFEMNGVKRVFAVTREGEKLELGQVNFALDDAGVTHFSLKLEGPPWSDYFLSMKEFKCLDGKKEVTCHVPYPYSNPQVVTNENFAWLEHSLLFLYKQPRDFGAKLWNGTYYQFEVLGAGLVGKPQAIDLNHISAPSDTPHIPPYTLDIRADMVPGSRWIDHLLIE